MLVTLQCCEMLYYAVVNKLLAGISLKCFNVHSKLVSNNINEERTEFVCLRASITSCYINLLPGASNQAITIWICSCYSTAHCHQSNGRRNSTRHSFSFFRLFEKYPNKFGLVSELIAIYMVLSKHFEAITVK